jgi:hypothetical protein
MSVSSTTYAFLVLAVSSFRAPQRARQITLRSERRLRMNCWIAG